MASFTPKKFDLSTINSGKKFEVGDGITPEAINAPIEAAALLQSLATNPPDYSQAGNVGTPIVEIGGTEDAPKFVFKNIKGEKGDKGERGEKGAQGEQGIQGVQGVQGEKGQDGKDGVDGKDGHTTPAPNLLINGGFTINQRSSFSIFNTAVAPYYPVDKWLLYEGKATITPYNARLMGDDNGKLSFRQYVFVDDSQMQQNWCLSLSGTSFSNGIFRIKVSDCQDYSGGEIIHNTLVDTDLPMLVPEVVFTLNFKCRTHKGAFLCVDIYSENAPSEEILTLHWVKLEQGEIATGYSIRPYSEELALCQNTFLPIPARTLFAGEISSQKSVIITIPLPSQLPLKDYAILLHHLTISSDTDGQWVAVGTNGKSESYYDFSIQPQPMFADVYSTFMNTLIYSYGFNLIEGTCASVYCTKNIFIDMDIYG